jgi:hypothetical protein
MLSYCSVGLDDRGVGVRVLVGSRILRIVKTGSTAHPAFYPVCTGGLSPGGGDKVART